jgi:hypothetical protein
MNPGKALKRIVIQRAVDEALNRVDNHPLLQGEGDIYLDVFNTGIVLNIKKNAQKYYPLVKEVLREVIEKELKKL